MKSLSEQILEMYKDKYSYREIAKELNVTRNIVAGIIWRHKNPGMYQKGVTSKEHNHRPPYGLRKVKI